MTAEPSEPHEDFPEDLPGDVPEDLREDTPDDPDTDAAQEPAGEPEPAPSAAPTTPVTLKISPMAHIAVVFSALSLMIPIVAYPVLAPLLLLPAAFSVLIARSRTVADGDGLTVRTLFGSRAVEWGDIEGLRFTKASSARARLASGGEMKLPGVTFSTLPALSDASGGRVPNPYA